jgi:predicted dehydrogenase
MPNLGILVGCGSVGKRHLSNLLLDHEMVIVVDSSESARVYVEGLKNKRITFRNNILSLSKLELKESNCTILATYGPDHLSQAKFLVEGGVKKLIIEKPLTDSVADLFELKDLVDKNKVETYCNLPTLFGGMKSKLTEISTKYNLGELKGAGIFGGAECLATNGLHYLDSINGVIDENPIEVFANINDSRINPRGEKFSHLEGTVEWVYKSGFRLFFHMNNSVSINTTWRFFWRNGIADKNSDGLFEIRVRETYASKEDKVTRYKPASKHLETVDLLGINSNPDIFRLFYEYTKAANIKSNFETSYLSMTHLFAALYSSKLGKRIKIADLHQLDKNIKWGIT